MNIILLSLKQTLVLQIAKITIPQFPIWIKTKKDNIANIIQYWILLFSPVSLILGRFTKTISLAQNNVSVIHNVIPPLFTIPLHLKMMNRKPQIWNTGSSLQETHRGSFHEVLKNRNNAAKPYYTYYSKLQHFLEEVS